MLLIEFMDIFKCFNYIKVRLILRYSSLLYLFRQFQFHKGSINTPYFAMASGAVNAFQFHKGSINTRYLGSFNSQINMFQFHKGSINTMYILYIPPTLGVSIR